MAEFPETAVTQPTILIVDDTPANLAVIGEVLHGEFKVLVATSGERALQIAQRQSPDLILLDVVMPGLNGYQVLNQLHADAATQAIPVIFLTALDTDQDEEYGLTLGVNDYITKPIKPAILLARVRVQLELKRARDILRNHNSYLEDEVSRRMAENDHLQLISIRALAHLAETRDPETGNHILRTQGYVALLARRMRNHPRFAGLLTDRYIELVTRAAPLHDIGKVGIPDAILLKPGKLTDEERAIMRTHAVLGAEALSQAERDVDQTAEFLQPAKEIAHWHHEWWNGQGYPDGLEEEAIPVSARLMAIADVFDALISPRVYKPAMPVEQARDMISELRGIQFDPAMVDAFLNDFDDFVAIARRYQESV